MKPLAKQLAGFLAVVALISGCYDTEMPVLTDGNADAVSGLTGYFEFESVLSDRIERAVLESIRGGDASLKGSFLLSLKDRAFRVRLKSVGEDLFVTQFSRSEDGPFGLAFARVLGGELHILVPNLASSRAKTVRLARDFGVALELNTIDSGTPGIAIKGGNRQVLGFLAAQAGGHWLKPAAIARRVEAPAHMTMAQWLEQSH